MEMTTNTQRPVGGVPELDMMAEDVLNDPHRVYSDMREKSAVGKILIPTFGHAWVITRYEEAMRVLDDPRFAVTSESFATDELPEDCLPYMASMPELIHDNTKLGRVVSRAFTVRRAELFRSAIENIADGLLDALPATTTEPVDLLETYAHPLPLSVICEFLGIPEKDHAMWYETMTAFEARTGDMGDLLRAMVASSESAVAERRKEPKDDFISELIRLQREERTGLSDTDVVAIVWQLIGGAMLNPAYFIANCIVEMLSRPAVLDAVRAGGEQLSWVVDEMLRLHTPLLITMLRYPQEDVEVAGTVIPKGEPVAVAIGSTNRDPRAFSEPDTFVSKCPVAERSRHLSFGHGMHYCPGAAVARLEVEIALTTLLERFPDLKLAVEPAELKLSAVPGTWRYERVPVTY